MKKIKDSFAGVIVGIILVIVGIVLLWWNEGNNVKNIKTVDELNKNYVDIKSSPIEKANEGKLVALSGKMVIKDDELEDETFNVKVKSAKLERIVEMYQWEETKDEDDNGTTYSYKKEWNSSRNDSSTFNDSKKHSNPEMEYESTNYQVSDIELGDFMLSDKQISLLPATDTLSLDSNVEYKEGFTIKDGYLTNSKNLDHPEIGDLRISYEYSDYDEISILAAQKDNTFTDYTSKVGKKTNKVMKGIHDGKSMITDIEQGNNSLKWILRLVGTLAIIFGISSILGPISTIASFVPILGGIVGTTLFLVSMLLGLAISLIVIAVAWIFFRPVLGIVLLLAAVALFIGVNTLLKKNKEKKAEA